MMVFLYAEGLGLQTQPHVTSQAGQEAGVIAATVHGDEIKDAHEPAKGFVWADQAAMCHCMPVMTDTHGRVGREVQSCHLQ